MSVLRSGLLLLRKDLRVLVRSRGLLSVLIGYPIVIAVLLAIALSGGDRRPSVAFVNLDAGSGRTVQVGDERLSVEDYATRLEEDIDLVRLSTPQAGEALADGRVSAVLTVPRGFIADLQSGLRSPVLTLQTNPRSPIEAQAIERNLESAVFRLNQALATAYVGQVLNLVDLIQDGGQVGVFGRSGNLLGLGQSDRLIRQVQAQLRSDGRPGLANRLGPLRDYISGVGRNLDLARPAAQSIASPIRLDIAAGPPGREPLSALGIAGALVVGLGLVGVLLAAALLSAEREDGVLSRLGRGLAGPGTIIGQKALLASIACTVVGIVLLVVVALSTSIAVGRWLLWLPALLLAGLAFGAFGLLIGALARETRTALLAGLMIALPLAVISLIPGSDIAYWASAVAGFGPAARTFQGLLVDPEVGSTTWIGMGVLAVVALVYGVAARMVLARRMHS
jgi:ABC-type transport system involved in cytochrome c biogenesis permease component